MQTTKDLQEIGLKYVLEHPDDAAAYGFDKELFKPWCVLNGLTYEQSSFNPAMNALLNRGVLKHVSGTRGWTFTNYSQETQNFLSLNAKGRREKLKGMLTPIEWSVVSNAVKLNSDSDPFTLSIRQKLFPTGTADGLLGCNAPTSISQNSHINDKWLTKLWGYGEWNNSANVLNEDVRVNWLRLTGYVDSVVQYPEIRYRVDAKGDALPSDILDLDGKTLVVTPEMAGIYRKMFEVRQLLTGKLTPETRQLLEDQRAAELDAEVAESEV